MEILNKIGRFVGALGMENSELLDTSKLDYILFAMSEEIKRELSES